MPRGDYGPRPGTGASLVSERSAVSAASDMSLPDWSDAASLQQWDVVESGFQGSGNPQTPGGLTQQTIAKSTKRPGEWKQASHALMRESDQEFHAVAELLSSIHRRNSVTDAKVKAAEMAVNNAMQTRVNETRRLEQRLNDQIERTEADLGEVDAARRALQTSLAMTEAQGNTAGHCIEQRMHRPAREQVRDRVEERLETEYEQLQQTKSNFSRGLAQLRAEHERLSADLRAMVADRDDKSRALQLDESTLRNRLAMLRAGSATPPRPARPKSERAARTPRDKEGRRLEPVSEEKKPLRQRHGDRKPHSAREARKARPDTAQEVLKRDKYRHPKAPGSARG